MSQQVTEEANVKVPVLEAGTISFSHLDKATFDHIIPKAKNGKNHITNYQLAHELCNRQKADRLPNAPRVSHRIELPQLREYAAPKDIK